MTFYGVLASLSRLAISHSYMNSLSSKKVIGIVSIANPFEDRNAWSGTYYKIRESIEKVGFDVGWIKIQPNRFAVWVIKNLLRLEAGHSWKRSK